ncbi:MAG: hypothetical protein IPH93_16655 [Saprospiraceae bacterium]|nr:hypothetical protein [Saprospiraceae bacterium]
MEEILSKDAKKFGKFDDPLLDAARIIVPKYNEAVLPFNRQHQDEELLNQE